LLKNDSLHEKLNVLLKKKMQLEGANI